jgi:tetratricopeptide (TPR) repeat protein
LGVLAVEQGQINSAKTKILEMKALLPEIEGKDKGRITALCDLLQGEALLAQGDLDGALAASQKACGPESPLLSTGYNWQFNTNISYSMDLAARVFAKKGDVAKAISKYETLFKIPYTYKSVYFVHPLFHYRLGILYEKAREVAKAKAQFEKFLELWKDADPGLPEVEDARKRLAGLKVTEIP